MELQQILAARTQCELLGEGFPIRTHQKYSVLWSGAGFWLPRYYWEGNVSSLWPLLTFSLYNFITEYLPILPV